MDQNLQNLTVSLVDRMDGQTGTVRRPLLVAIDGKSGVGKSTLAETLSQHFDTALIACDDFYAGGVNVRNDSPKELAHICIDRARLRSVLQQLKIGRQTRYAPFDWDAFDGTVANQDKIVHPHPMLVLEGVYSNHPDFDALIDFSVLLRIPEAERQLRLHRREGEITEWERQWHSAENWYFATVARPEAFDVVIGNT